MRAEHGAQLGSSANDCPARPGDVILRNHEAADRCRDRLDLEGVGAGPTLLQRMTAHIGLAAEWLALNGRLPTEAKLDRVIRRHDAAALRSMIADARAERLAGDVCTTCRCLMRHHRDARNRSLSCAAVLRRFGQARPQQAVAR